MISLTLSIYTKLMHKGFKNWHTKKEFLEIYKQRPPFFHEREVWFCNLGLNIGHEQNGVGTDFLRPVIIVKKLSGQMCLATPLTTKIKDRPYQIIFKFNSIPNVALFSQIRSLDTKRLLYKLGTLEKNTFLKIKENLRQFFT